MDDGPTASIILVIMVLINMIYNGFSAAMSQLNIKEIEEKALKKKDRKSARLLKLIHTPQNFIDSIQLVITLLNMLIGWIYMEHFVNLTKRLLQFLLEKTLQFQMGVEILAFIATFLTLVIVLYIFLLVGVSLPKKIALGKPKGWSYFFVDVIYVCNQLLLPFTSLISLTTHGIVKVLGLNPNNDEGDVTEEEIIHMVNEGHEQGLIEAGEAEMISNIFEYHDKEAQDIMTHRNHIIALESTMPFSEAVDFVLDGKHSRYLVFEENIDHILGVLHLKDVLRYQRDKKVKDIPVGNIKELLREPEFIPLTKNVHDLFQEMQSRKLQMVIVIDEYGQTAGLVAMEDILEEIVGNIMDEYDVEEEYIEEKGEDEYIIEGKTPLEELEDKFNISFNEEEFETLNGLLISKMDKIPDEDEQFEVMIDGYLFKILSVHNNMIQSVLVTKKRIENEGV
ncbi:MAG: HlyC/CorC family transporter [Lachnospiraceae bacterium]|nr:HlyC/CorC family transporter [Lachnospiraceae bacterium]